MKKLILLTIMLFNYVSGFAQLTDLMRDYLSIQLFYGMPKPSDNRVGYMNTKGKVIIPPQFLNGQDFHGDYANIIKGGAFGYVTKKGKVTLFPGYAKVYWFNDDLGIAVKGLDPKNKEEAYQIINRQGEIITAAVYIHPGIPNEGYAPVRINGRSNYIDKNGKLLYSGGITPMGDPIYLSTTKYLDTVSRNPLIIKKGLMDTAGKIIIKAQYDDLSGYFSSGLMMVANNGKQGFIDEDGVERIPLTYDRVEWDFADGLIPVMKDRKWGIINKDNNVVIPFIYDQIRNFSGGLAWAAQGLKIGYIDKSNKIVIPFIYDQAMLGGNFKEGLTVFRSGNKYGYMNKQGKPVIEAKYDSASDFTNGLAKVKLNSYWGFINTRGKEVIPVKYKSLGLIRSGLIKFVE
jgi:hypothetical protein